MSGNIVNVTDASFDQDVLQSDTPVLVDYWAEWCGPCKMIAPVLEEIAEEYEGKLKVCKLNIDENEQTPPKFNIRGIPTLMLFKNGNVDATKVGALSKSQLAAFLDSNLRAGSVRPETARGVTSPAVFLFLAGPVRSPAGTSAPNGPDPRLSAPPSARRLP